MSNRLLSILSASLFIFQGLSAQDDKKDPRLMLGFNAGANFSRTSNSDTFPANFTKRNRLGIALGLNGMQCRHCLWSQFCSKGLQTKQ
jgi:hypothetical protein